MTLGCVNAFFHCQGHNHASLLVELRVESSGVAIKGMNLEEFLEKFAKDEENEKVATNFYPF